MPKETKLSDLLNKETSPVPSKEVNLSELLNNVSGEDKLTPQSGVRSNYGDSQYLEGLTAYQDPKELQSRQQGVIHELANSAAQGASTAVTSTIGGTVGLANGLLNIIANKDESFFDNPTFKVLEQVDEWNKETFPVYASKVAETGNFSDILQREKLLPGLFNGLGFVGGAMLSGGANTAVLKQLPKLMTMSKLGQTSKAINLLKTLGVEESAASNLLNRVGQATKGLDNLAVAGFGRVYESALEGNQVYDDAIKNGASEEEANYLRSQTFGAQMLLALPDAWQYGKLMAGFKGSSKAVNNIVKEGEQYVGKQLTGKAAKLANVASVLGQTGTEAGEEWYQSMTQRTANILAGNGIEDQDTNYVNTALSQGIKESLTDPEAWQSAFLGAVIGGGMQSVAEIKNPTSETQNRNTQVTVDLLNKYTPQHIDKVLAADQKLNEWGTIEKQKNDLIATVIKNPEANFEQIEQAKNQYKQLENLQLSNLVKVGVETGKFEELLNEMELLAKTSNEELKAAYDVEDKIDDNGSIKTVQSIINEKIQTAKKYRGIYEQVQEQYSNVPEELHPVLYDYSTQYVFNQKKYNELGTKEAKLTHDLIVQNTANREVNPDFIENPNNPLAKQIQAVKQARNYYTIENNKILDTINNIIDPQIREQQKQEQEQQAQVQKEEEEKQQLDNQVNSKLEQAKLTVQPKEEEIQIEEPKPVPLREKEAVSPVVEDQFSNDFNLEDFQNTQETDFEVPDPVEKAKQIVNNYEKSVEDKEPIQRPLTPTEIDNIEKQVEAQTDEQLEEKRKIIDGFTVANLSRSYRQSLVGNKKDINNEIFINYNQDILNPNKFLSGEVTLKLLNNDTYTSIDPTTGTSKIVENPKDVDNTVIEIYAENSFIGYLHTYDYVLNNTAEKDNNNVQQANKIKALREQIVSKGELKGAIINKSTGSLALDVKEQYLSLTERGFDNRTVIGIAKDGKFFDGLDVSVIQPIGDLVSKEENQGRTFVAVPSSNGEYIATYAQHKKLDNDSKKSIVEAVKMFVNNQMAKEEASAFINQFIQVRNNLNKNVNYNGFLFGLNEFDNGDRAFSLNINGKATILPLDSIQELENQLDNAYFNTSRYHLSNNDIVNHIKNGKLISTNKTYKQFLSDNLTTRIQPIKLNNGEITYTVQPNIVFEIPNSQTNQLSEPVKDTQPLVDKVKNLPRSIYKPNQNNSKVEYLPSTNLSESYIPEGSTANKLKQVVNTMVYEALMDIKEGKPYDKEFNNIKNMFESLIQYHSTGEAQEDRYTIEDSNRIINEIQTILTNFKDYVEFAKTKINQLGYQESSYDELIGEEADREKSNFEDGATFLQNPKNTISANLKFLLSFIAAKDSANNTLPTYIGTNQFIEFDSLYEDILAELADQEFSYDNFINKLSTSDKNPYFKDVVAILQNSSETTRNEFTAGFAKIYADFSISKIETKDNKVFNKVFSANRNSLDKVILNEWDENKLLNNLYELNNENEVVVNKTELENLKQLYKETKEDKSKVKQLVNTIGLKVSDQTIQQLQDPSKNSILGKVPYNNLFIKGGLFYHILEYLNSTNAVNFNEQNGFKQIAKLESRYSEQSHTNSHKNGEGKSVYSYVQPSFASIVINKVKRNTDYVKQLLSTSYASGSTWLEQLQNPESYFAKSFDLTFEDTLNVNDKDGVKNKNMSPREYEYSKIVKFINSNTGDSNGRYISKFVHLTPSDKTTFNVYQALKHNVDFKEGIAGDKTWKELEKIVKAEYRRILKSTNNTHGETNIDGYKEGSKYFFVFPELNNKLNKYFEQNIPYDVLPDEVKLKIKEAVEKSINKSIQQQKNQWLDLGIITNEGFSNFIDTNYQKLQKNNIDNFVADYTINYIIANYNISAIVTGDPAFFWKKSVDKTFENYFKRIAKDVAPGTFVGNDNYVQVFANDPKGNFAISKNIAQYKEILGEKSSAYEEIDIADAQEYTTFKEHLYILHQLGKISDEQYNNFLNKDNLSNEELKIVLQPIKPVYVNNVVTDDYNRVIYIKSSSFPLIPQLTKGLELDNIRIALEKTSEKYEGKGRLAFKTATKVGGSDFTDLVENGKIKTNLEFKPTILNREGFRIQQEVPFDEEKNKILEGSQIRKLIFEGLRGNDKFQQLEQRFNELHIDLQNIAFKKLREDLKIDENGNFIDLEGLANTLKEEALARGYNINDLKFLALTEDKKSFRIPLWANPQNSKYEALINSLVNNRIFKQKLPGKSYILGSEFGFDGMSESIKYTNLYDPKIGLQPSRLEDKVVKPAQVFITPQLFRTVNNLPKDFDVNILSQEQLQLVGYRIPTQGHNSMSPLEIAGFLPEELGDLIIPPKDFTKQMGSDFDIDKLYIHIKPFDDSEISNIQKEIFDIYYNVLTSPEVFEKMITPLDMMNLPEVKKFINENTKQEKINYFSPLRQSNNFFDGVAGKVGTGRTSLLNTFNSNIQPFKITLYDKIDKYPIKLAYKAEYGTIKEKDIIEMDLSNPFGVTGKRKSDVISAFQSASVDNIKELLLNTINYNEYTHNAMSTLALTIGDEEYIAYFLAQPIIKEYIKNYSALDDTLSQGYGYSKKDKIDESYTNAVKKFNLKGTFNGLEGWNTPLGIEDFKNEIINPTGLQEIILNKFIKLSEIGEEISNTQLAINTDTSGVGEDLFKLLDKIKAADDLNKDIFTYLKGKEKLVQNTIAGNAVDIARKFEKTLSQLYPYSSPLTTLVITKVQNQIKRDLYADEKKELFNFIRSYSYTNLSTIFDNENIQDLRERLFFGKNTLAKRWLQFKNSNEGKQNYLAKRIQTQTDNFPNTIKYTASAEDRLDSINNTIYFIDMLKSENDIIRDLAIDTVKYLYVNGGNQDAISFIKFIPAEYLYINNFSSEVNINFNDTQHVDNIVKQYFQSNPNRIPVDSTGTFKREKSNLFQLVNGNYEPIDKLGQFGFSEVQINTDNAKSLLKQNQTKGNLQNQQSVKTTSKVFKIPNTPVSKAIDDLGLLSQLDGKEKLKNAFDIISRDTNNKARASVAKYLTRFVNRLADNFKITIKENFEADGRFDPLNNELIIKSDLNPNRVIHTVLHESLHAFSLNFINKLDSDTLTNEELEIKQNLEGLFNKLEKEFTKKYGEEFTNYISKIRSNTTAVKDKTYNAKFYGLKNKAEFISEIFTSKEFFDELNEIKFNGTKSIYDRFIEIIESIFEAIGIKVNKGTALEEGLKQALNILEVSTNELVVAKAEYLSSTNSVDKYINNLQNRIANLNNAIKNSKDKLYQETLKNRLSKLNEQLENLQLTKATDIIIKQGYDDIEYIRDVFAKTEINEHEINDLRKLTDSYKYILTELKFEQPEQRVVYDEQGNKIVEDNPFIEEIEKLLNKIQSYDRKVIKLEREKIESIYKGLFNTELKFEDIVKEANSLSKMTLDSSRQGNALLQVLNQLIKNANVRALEESGNLQAQRELAYEEIKNNPTFKSKGWDLFLGKDESGKWNGGLVTRFTSNYWNKRYDLRNKAKKSKDIKDWQNYYKWIRDTHTIIDIRKLQDGKFSESYIKQIESEVGKDYAGKLIKEAKEKLAEYNYLENQEIEQIESLDLDEAEKSLLIDRFRAENSPINYLEEIIDKKKNVVGGEYVINKNAYKYVTERPFKNKNGKSTGFYDSNFEIVESDEKLLSYYNYLKQTIDNGLDVIPEAVLEASKVKGNFIPYLEKDLLDKYNEEGMSGLAKGIPDKLIDWIAVNKTNDIGKISRDSEGNPQLTVGMLKDEAKYDPLTNKYEKDLTNKATDLNKVLEAWIDVTTTYKHKSINEDQIKLTLNYVNDLVANPELTDGKQIINVQELAKFNEQFFYGSKINQEYVSDKKIYTPKQQEEKERLENALLELENQLKSGELTEDKYLERLAKTNKEIEKLGKNVSGGQAIRSVLQYVQLKSQGWNLFSPVTEMLFGIISNTTHAAGKKDFTNKELTKAYGIMMNSAYRKKVDFIMNKFQVLGEINGLDTKSSKLSKGLKVLNPYELAKRQDYFTKGASFIAMMLKEKVGERSLFDLYTEEGLVEGVDKTYISLENGSEALRFKNKADQIIKLLHGNYDINSPIEGNRFALFAVASQFRRWIFEGVAQRFENESFDPIIGRTRKGRYKSYATAFEQLGAKEFIKSIMLGLVQNKNAFEGLSEVDQENMRKNMVGMYWNISLMMLLTLIKGLTDDDEEKKWVAINFILNQGYRLQSDINFYHNPAEFESISKNFVPAFGLIKDYSQFTKAVIKNIEGEPEVKQGIWKGQNKALIEFADLIPATSSAKRFVSSVKQDFDKFK